MDGQRGTGAPTRRLPPARREHAGFNRFAHSAGPGIGDWRIGVHFLCNVGLVVLVALAGLVGLVGLTSNIVRTP